MNLNPLKWLSSQVAKSLEIRNRPSEEYTRRVYPHLNDGNILTKDSGQLDQNYITHGYQKNATVYAIINTIIRNAKTIPFKIYQVKESNAIKNYKALTSGTPNTDSLFQAKTIKSRSFVEATDTRVEEVLRNADYHKFLANIIGYGKISGNRYIYGIKDSRGRVGELHVLPSQHMEIVSGGFAEQVRGYRFNYTPTDQYEFDADEICHIADFNPDFNQSGSHLYGQSPLRAAYRSLETNNEALDTGKETIQRGFAKGLLFPKDADTLDQPEAEMLEQGLANKMKRNRGGLAITGLPMDWVDFSQSMEDLALIQQFQLTDRQLCAVYGVPYEMVIGHEGSTLGSNVREIKTKLFQDAIIPELVTLRESLNEFLVKPYGEDLYLDFDFTVIPELQMEVNKLVDQLYKSHWLTSNEKRRIMNHSEDDSNDLMNSYLVPVNLTPLENMGMNDLDAMERVLSQARSTSRQPQDDDLEADDL